MTIHPKIAVIGTGGTIAMGARHPLDWIEYGESGVVDDIGATLGKLSEFVPEIELVAVPFRALASTAIGPAEWLELLRLVRTVALDPAIHGIVLTHGTATLEETAYFLHLAAAIDIPIVLVGAQRPIATASSDAPANFRAAVLACAAQVCRGLGTLVVFNNLIFGSRDVTKITNFGLDAFGAAEFGPLGRVEPDGQVSLLRRPTHRYPLALPDNIVGLDSLPRVDIALSYAGADGTTVRALFASGAKAIVSVGLPPGRTTPEERSALVDAADAGILIVQCSRAMTGAVRAQRYLDSVGFIAAGDLMPQKARILAMLALVQTQDRTTIQQLFLDY